MLKKLGFLLSLTPVLFFGSQNATMKNCGKMNFSGGSIMVPFENCKTGNVTLTDMIILKILNEGKMALDSCTIHKTVINHGQFFATDTKFNEDITTAKGNTTLLNCEVRNILINDHASKPIIYLYGETHVTGNIEFKSGNGEVYAHKTAVIDGDVKGGTVTIEEIR